MSRRDRFLPSNGIEVAEEGIVPEQPDDPLHYEMKIPPEPKNDKPGKDDGSAESDKQETKVVRDEDKGQRQPGG